MRGSIEKRDRPPRSGECLRSRHAGTGRRRRRIGRGREPWHDVASLGIAQEPSAQDETPEEKAPVDDPAIRPSISVVRSAVTRPSLRRQILRLSSRARATARRPSCRTAACP